MSEETDQRPAMDEASLQRLLKALFERTPEATTVLQRHLRSALPEAGYAGTLSIESVEHSVGDQNLGLPTARETDLVLRGEWNGQPLLILTEVKLCAPFGHRQIEDYCRRAQCLAAAESDRLCLTLLIAPRRCCQSPAATPFDGRISLEELCEALAQVAECISDELPHHAFINELEGALHIAQMGYQPVASLARYEQYQYYRAFVSDYAPHLELNESSGSLYSLDFFFRSPSAPGYVKHRLAEGLVVIEKMKHGVPSKTLTGAIAASNLKWHMTGRRKETIHIYCSSSLPALDMSRSFDQQSADIATCIDEVSFLINWMSSNHSLIA